MSGPEYDPEEEIEFKGGKCWICGAVENLSLHHTIPKHMRPLRNVVVPVCFKCHDLLNYEDTRGLVKFAFKIQRSYDELARMSKNMVALLKREGGKG